MVQKRNRNCEADRYKNHSTAGLLRKLLDPLEQVVLTTAGASTKLFDGDFNLVTFDPTDFPDWRQGCAMPSTSVMLEDIRTWMEQWRAAESTVSKLPSCATMLAARFIYFNNKAEVR